MARSLGAPAAARPRPAGVSRDLRRRFNLLVLKTPPSGAQPLAAALDAEKFKEVAGTIAGDDLSWSSRPRASARRVQKRMEDLLR